MAAYAVEARPRVRRALRQFDHKARNDVLAKMRALATDPRPQVLNPFKAIRGFSGYEPVTTGSSMR